MFLAVIGLFGAIAALRGKYNALWRCLAGFALFLVLLNPTLQREVRSTLTNIAVILVDESASQAIGQRHEQTEKALQDLQRQIGSLPNLEVRIARAGGALSADSKGTELFGPLLQTLADIPQNRLSGVVMITDGQVHDVPDAAALPAKVPLHALITGQKEERDRRIVLIDAPRFAILNTIITLHYRVEDTDGGQERALVQARLNGALIATRSVPVGEAQEQKVEIKTGGENVVELTVDKAPAELSALNNKTAVSIKGMRENLRVLLISGEPYAGERTWRNLLKSDPAVDLVHFTILRPPDRVDATPVRELSLIAFPVRELFQDKIKDFDLIIFDRYERRNILPMIYFGNMADYVREGGALLVVSGPEDAGSDSVYQTALADVLPTIPSGEVTATSYLPLLTDKGIRHPVTRELSGWNGGKPKWSRWFRVVNSTAHAEQGVAQTLLSGAAHDLLVLGNAGEGRTASLLSDQVWLWARGFEGGGPHTDLLRRIVHWLMKEPELEEESLRAWQSGKDIVIERQSMQGGGTALQVQRPDGAIETRRLEQAAPGLWRANVAATQPGLYRVTQGDRTALLAVGPANPQEFFDARSTAERLQPLTSSTGGSTQRLQNANRISIPRLRYVREGERAAGPGWLGLTERNVTDLKGVEYYPLLQGVAGLLLVAAGLSFAWWREGR